MGRWEKHIGVVQEEEWELEPLRWVCPGLCWAFSKGASLSRRGKKSNQLAHLHPRKCWHRLSRKQGLFSFPSSWKAFNSQFN